MSLIRFKGIPGKKDTYRGLDNEVELVLKEGESAEVTDKKAYQLLKDFPIEWELVNKNGEDFLKMYEGLYLNKMQGGAKANKGFTIIDPWGNKNEYPPDVEVVVRRPSKLAGEKVLNTNPGEFTVCKTPGCKTILGKGEECEKHPKTKIYR